jgi:hypothetical protein
VSETATDEIDGLRRAAELVSAELGGADGEARIASAGR